MAEGKEYERYSEIIFGVLERNDQMEGMLQELSATFDLPVIVIDPSGKIEFDSGAEQLYEQLGIEESSRSFWTGLMGEYYAGESTEGETDKILKKEVGKGLMAAGPLLVRGILTGFCITFHEKRRNAAS